MDHDLYGKSKAFLWHQLREGPYDFSFNIEDLRAFLGIADGGRSEEALIYLRGEGLIRVGSSGAYQLTQRGRAWALEQELSSPRNWANKIEDTKKVKYSKTTELRPKTYREPASSESASIINTPVKQFNQNKENKSPLSQSKRSTNLSTEKQPRKNQVKVLLDDSELKYLESLVGTVGDDKASVLRNLLFAHFHRSDGINVNDVETNKRHRRTNQEETERLANLVPAMFLAGRDSDHVLSEITASEGLSIGNNASDEDIRAILSFAAKSATGSIVNLIPDSGVIRNKVNGYLDGIRLLYQGSIELQEGTVPVRFIWFRPHA